MEKINNKKQLFYKIENIFSKHSIQCYLKRKKRQEIKKSKSNHFISSKYISKDRYNSHPRNFSYIVDSMFDLICLLTFCLFISIFDDFKSRINKKICSSYYHHYQKMQLVAQNDVIRIILEAELSPIRSHTLTNFLKKTGPKLFHKGIT